MKRRWTSTELALLWEHARSLPAPQIAKLLNRSLGAICSKAHRLGLSLDTHMKQ